MLSIIAWLYNNTGQGNGALSAFSDRKTWQDEIRCTSHVSLRLLVYCALVTRIRNQPANVSLHEVRILQRVSRWDCLETLAVSGETESYFPAWDRELAYNSDPVCSNVFGKMFTAQADFRSLYIGCHFWCRSVTCVEFTILSRSLMCTSESPFHRKPIDGLVFWCLCQCTGLSGRF